MATQRVKKTVKDKKVKNSRKRNSEYAKLLRNCNEISQGWECLEKEICSYEENTINGMELLVV